MGGKPKAPARNLELEAAQQRALDEQSASLARQAEAAGRQAAALDKQSADLAATEAASADARRRRQRGRISLLAGPETGAMAAEEERALKGTLGA